MPLAARRWPGWLGRKVESSVELLEARRFIQAESPQSPIKQASKRDKGSRLEERSADWSAQRAWGSALLEKPPQGETGDRGADPSYE